MSYCLIIGHLNILSNAFRPQDYLNIALLELAVLLFHLCFEGLLALVAI